MIKRGDNVIESIKKENTSVYTLYKTTYKKIDELTKEQYGVMYQENKNDVVQTNYDRTMHRNTTKEQWADFQAQLDREEEEMIFLFEKGYPIDTLRLDGLGDLEKQIEKPITSRGDSTLNETSSVSQLTHKINRIKQRHDSMYREALEMGTLTINSLYASSFKGTGKANAFTKEEVNCILKLNQIEPTKEHQFAASKLMAIGKDVSKDNIVKFQNIEAAIESLDAQEEVRQANERLNEGEKLGERPLIKEDKILYTEKTIQEIVDDLAKVDDITIEKIIDEGTPVTIGNLREGMLKHTKEALDKRVSNQHSKEASKEDAQEDTVEDIKEQIKTIRARLSAESATRLSEKMPLESSKLHEVAQELKQLEEVKIEKVAQSVELPLTDTHKNQLQQVIDATQLLGKNKQYSIVALKDGEQSLEMVHKALIAYHEGETVVDEKLGDTIVQLEEAIDQFIKEHKLPQDPLTREGVRALILNELPIEQEHLEQVKQTLLKLDTLSTSLTPECAAMWIKEGINPYKASINHIVEWLGQEQFPQLKQSLGERIVALEEKGKINATQKQSLIGLYRILTGVAKHKEEVAGYLVKNQLHLTIEKLDQALKYIGKTQVIEKTIDATFGERESNNLEEDTSRNFIQKNQEYTEEVLEKLRKIEHVQLALEFPSEKAYEQVKTMIYPFLKHIVQEELDNLKKLDTLPKSLIEKLETAKHVVPSVVEVMAKHNIPITLSNLHWIQKLYDNPKLFAQMLEKEEVFKEELPKSLEAFEEKLQTIEKTFQEQKENAMQQGDFQGYKTYKQLEEVVSVQKQLIEKEGLYQIPFTIDGKSKMVNLYIQENNHKQKDETKGTKMIMSYDTPHLGQVKAYIYLKGETIQYHLTTETKGSREALEKNETRLRQCLDALGYRAYAKAFTCESKEHHKPIVMAIQEEGLFETFV